MAYDKFPGDPINAAARQRLSRDEEAGPPSGYAPSGPQTVGSSSPNPPAGFTFHLDLRHMKQAADERERTVDLVERDVENVMSYHGWSTEQQAASDAVNDHLKYAMRAVILNVPACGDRMEAIRALSMVRMLVNRALSLGGTF